MMITGFIGSGMWTFPSRVGLCSKRMGPWLKDSKAGDCSHLKASPLTCLEVDTGYWLGASATLDVDKFRLSYSVVNGF